MQKKKKHNKSKYISFILNLSLISAADARMHAVLKGLGITDQAISFVVDSSNGNKVKSSRAQGSLGGGSDMTSESNSSQPTSVSRIGGIICTVRHRW